MSRFVPVPPQSECPERALGSFESHMNRRLLSSASVATAGGIDGRNADLDANAH
jgi:hypothetical protein